MDLRERIRNRVESLRDEVVALTQALIRIPTLNPPGDAYAPCAELIGERLKRRGFSIEYVRGEGTPGDSDRYPRMNVIARFEGARPGPCVHFNGHTDVVAVGAGWTVDPFGGEVRDGRVYGRGACDMKGGIAASIIAVEALIAECPDLIGALEISGTVDEESGGYGGVAHLAQRGYFSKPRVDHVIIPEPLNVDRVCLGHRGVWWATIETKGRIAHGSMPFLGDSAIRHMAAVLDRFERELYPKIGAKRTTMPVVPPGARASTMNINAIHGGLDEGFSGFPSRSWRQLPHHHRPALSPRREPAGGARRGQRHPRGSRDHPAGFPLRTRGLWEVSPTMTDADAPVVTTVSDEIHRLFDRPAEHVISPGTYDQKHVARFGGLRDCIAYGPGVLDLAHQPDEWVGIDDMVASATIMALSAARLTGNLDA